MDLKQAADAFNIRDHLAFRDCTQFGERESSMNNNSHAVEGEFDGIKLSLSVQLKEIFD